jgi:hypothetical protein
VAAYRTTSDGTAAAQRLGAQQLEYFFDTVMDNLRAQAEGTSQISRQLAAQQELAREATQELTRVSTDNYMDFLDTMFSFYHGGASRTRRRAEETQRRVEEAKERAEEAERRAEETERNTSAAEIRGGDQGEEDGAGPDAGPRSQSIWVRTSGRSKVRGRNPSSRGRSSRRR